MKKHLGITIALLLLTNSLLTNSFITSAQVSPGFGLPVIDTGGLSVTENQPDSEGPENDEQPASESQPDDAGQPDDSGQSDNADQPGAGDQSDSDGQTGTDDQSNAGDHPDDSGQSDSGDQPDIENLPDQEELSNSEEILTEDILMEELDQLPAGAPEEEIEIEDADSLMLIGQDAAYPLDATYILTDDITLEAEWEPLGSAATPFTGTFNGDGHTISGLMINQPDIPAGLFSVTGQGAQIQNLTLQIITVSGDREVGALAGRSNGTLFTGCFAVSDGTGTVAGYSQVGGLVGNATGNTALTGCGAAVDILAGDGWAGGLIGQITGKTASSHALIDQCYATGKVEQTESGPTAKGAGGLAGSIKYTDITNCYATGEVSTQGLQAGGLVGRSESTSTIEKSLASGNVLSFNSVSSGIVCETDGQTDIRNCVAANKYLAVFQLFKGNNPITTSTFARQSGNVAYVNMAYFHDSSTADSGTAKSMNELRTESTYTDLSWDFSDIWEWDGANKCPKLRTAGSQPGDTLKLDPQEPRITGQPNSAYYTYINMDLEIRATVTGSNLTYQWLKDGTPLINSVEEEYDEDQEIITGADTSVLLIKNVQYSPNSAYVLMIKSSHGDTVSRVANVRVTPDASVPKVTGPDSQTLVEGERAIWKVTAVKEREAEELSYLWERSTDSGENWSPIPKATADTYTTPILTTADSGTQYRCVVTNTYFTTSKSVTSQAADLTVLRAIKSVIVTEKNITMKVGEIKTLTAYCLPEDAEQDKALYWEVGYGYGVVTVDRSTGEVHAVRAGTASIIASAKSNYDISAVCFITVEEETVPGPILIETDDAPLQGRKIVDDLKDGQGNNKTIVLRASETVTWKSNDKKVATVDTGGTVRYIASGTCVITATNTGGNSAQVTLTIRDMTPRLPVSTVSVYTKSESGTAVTILPSDTFHYNDICISSVRPAPKSGTFTIDTAKAPTCYLNADGIPKGKYVLELKAMRSGSEIGSPFSVTVNVYDQIPAAKVKLPGLNIFYQDVEGKISITGKDLPTITDVRLLPSGNDKDGDVTKNFGITKDGGEFFLYSRDRFDSLLNGKPAVKGILEIWYQGYSEPYRLKVTIPAKKTAPKIKFTKATQSVDYDNDLNIDFQVTGGEVVKAEPYDPEGFLKNFYQYVLDENILTLSLDDTRLCDEDGEIKSSSFGKTYSARMNLWLKGAREPLALTVGVKLLRPGTRPSFKLSSTSVTLNRAYEGQKHNIDIICSQANADYEIEEIICNEKLDIGNFSDSMTVELTSNADKRTYKCWAVVSYREKTTYLPFSVKVIDKEMGLTLGGKKGNIDLNAREQTGIEWKPVLKDYLGDVTNVRLESYGDEESDHLFAVSLTPEGRVRLTANTDLGYAEEFVLGQTYKLKLIFEIEATEADRFGKPFYETVESAVISVKPMRSKVKHNLPKAVTMYAGSTSHEEIIDLTPAFPAGAAIDRDRFNDTCSQANATGAFYCYLDDRQRLHILLKDSTEARIGKSTLTFPVFYEGQGLDKIGADYGYKPADLKIIINVVR